MKARPHIHIMDDLDRAANLSLSDAKAQMKSIYLTAQHEIGKDAALDCLLTCLFISNSRLAAVAAMGDT